MPPLARQSAQPSSEDLAMLVIGLSPALRLYLAFHDVNLYTNVFCRLDGLMAGSLLALAVALEPERVLQLRRCRLGGDDGLDERGVDADEGRHGGEQAARPR